MLKILLLGITCLIGVGHTAHPFYVSILDMHPNPTTGRLECSLKLFTDDLELAIKQHVGEANLNLGSSLEKAHAAELVNQYIQSRFSASSRNKSLEIQFVGKEGDVDAQWIYFEILFPAGKLPDKVDLSWTSLLDLLPGQKNLLHLHPAPHTRTYIFDQDHTRQSIPLTL